MSIKIGEYIKDLRLEKGMSTKDLGRLSGLNPSYVSRIERGDRNPLPGTLKKIAPYVNVSYEKLMQVAGFMNTELVLVETVKEGVTLSLVKELVAKGIITNEDSIPDDIMQLIVSTVKLEVKLQCEAQEESK